MKSGNSGNSENPESLEVLDNLENLENLENPDNLKIVKKIHAYAKTTGCGIVRGPFIGLLVVVGWLPRWMLDWPHSNAMFPYFLHGFG